MHTIRFYLDFASPYAYLAFKALPQALEGISHTLEYRPIVLGALFQAQGITPPPAIAAKHAWIKRHTHWLAKAQNINFAWPAAHPFNSLPLLRIAIACSHNGNINRYTAETLFDHVWGAGGADALDETRMPTLHGALAQQWQSTCPLGSDANKTRLRANTDEAVAAGVFGAPTFVVDGQLFWGFDALPMLREYLLAG